MQPARRGPRNAKPTSTWKGGMVPVPAARGGEGVNAPELVQTADLSKLDPAAEPSKPTKKDAKQSKGKGSTGKDPQASTIQQLR